MKRRSLFVLLAVFGLGIGLGCQIADLLAARPTPPPMQPLAIRTVAAPTTQSIVAATLPPFSPVAASPIAPQTLTAIPPVTLPTQPPALPSTCTNPNAAITSLVMDSTVSGLIEVCGTATRADMDYWKVEFRPEAKTNYEVLNRSDKAVTDGILALWSTKTTSNGVYYVRLVIVQKDGNFATPCEFRLTVAN
jgi:hypothetical protein